MGRRYTDEELNSLIGQKKNRLTLIKYKGQNKNYKYKFDMECDCGNIRENGDYYSWKNGVITACRKCMLDEYWENERKQFTDLTGVKIGMLTIIKRGEDLIKNGRHTRRWWCLCDCQLELPEKERKLVLIRESSLLKVKEPTQSCGCLQKLAVSKNFKKYNKFIEKDKYYIGFTDKNEPFFFDKDIYEEIKDFCWYITSDGYVRTNDKRSFHCLLHRVATKCPDEYEVDHIHGKPTRNDNRKNNLRIATRKENSRNIGIRTNNKSGVIGVTWSDLTSDWVAQICVDGKTIVLGHSINFEEMVKVRKEAEDKYFGEWSYDNSMKINLEGINETEQ